MGTPYAYINLGTPYAYISLVTPYAYINLVTPYAYINLVTPYAYINLVTPYAYFNFGVWNIHGLFVKVNNYKLNKLRDPELLKRLNNFDILCFQEVQCGTKDTESLVQGYSLVPFHRIKWAFQILWRKFVIIKKWLKEMDQST